MSLIFIEGFDWLDPALTATALETQFETLWGDSDFTAGSPDASVIQPGRLGSGSCVQMGNGQFMRSPIISSGANGVVGWAMKMTQFNPIGGTVFIIESATGSVLFTLRATASGLLDVRAGFNGGQFFENTSVTLPTNQWVYVEVKFRIGPSEDIEIIIDGVSQHTSTGVQTNNNNTGITSWSRFRVHSASNFNQNMQIDDVYALGNGDATNTLTPLGKVNIRALYPDASGGTNTFTASDSGAAATHYTMVDESPSDDGDATYLEGSVSGERELFSHDPSIPPGAILGVQHVVACRVTDNTSRDIRFTTESGGTTTDHETITIGSTDYARRLKTYELNPASGVAWTETDLDGTNFGITID